MVPPSTLKMVELFIKPVTTYQWLIQQVLAMHSLEAFLAEISKQNLDFSEANVRKALDIANAKAALTTTKYGGISAIPSIEEYN